MSVVKPPIRSKRQMYELLARGEFGNTNPSWVTVASWLNRTHRSDLWGIRSMSPTDRRLRLDVPTANVMREVEAFSGGFQISPMVDQWTEFRGEVWDAPGGIRVHGVFGKLEHKWRVAKEVFGQEWLGLSAKMVLDQVMWPGDREDLRELLEAYPGHCVEFNACTMAVGTVPNRNCVIWEVRCTDGSYERWC